MVLFSNGQTVLFTPSFLWNSHSKDGAEILLSGYEDGRPN